MIHDLRSILDGWEYEPGKISVRKIIGRDGREKLQTRVDMGLLQLELAGRPDGRRPSGLDSLLDWHEQRLREHIQRTGSERGFSLSEDECRDLRHEGHMYYQRYLSLFVLEDFAAVQRDTQRSLRLIDFCRRYAAEQHDREALEPQRAYVLMMNARAQVYEAMKRGDASGAFALAESAIARLRALAEQAAENEEFEPRPRSGEDEKLPELGVLAALRVEVLEHMPTDAPARLHWELQNALAREDYERAAALRDKIASTRRGLRPASELSSPAAQVRKTG